VSGWGFVGQGSGTSFSSPVTAGGLACLWQSLPSFSARQIREGVRSTASRANNPDDLYGWGIPNLMNARTLLAAVAASNEVQDVFPVFPIPFSGAPYLRNNLSTAAKIQVEVLSVTGQILHSTGLNLQGAATVKLNELNALTPGIYFLRISSGTSQQVVRAVKI
jgi:subtilisin family serine protease